MPSKVDWQALFPFEPRAIELDGRRYAYVESGQGDTLLAVHGNPTWSFYWRDLIRGLAPKYRVIAVDHIGCGRSDKPRNYAYRLAQHVENLLRFIERLDLQPAGNVSGLILWPKATIHILRTELEGQSCRKT